MGAMPLKEGWMDQHDVIEKLQEIERVKKELKGKIADKSEEVHAAYLMGNPMGAARHFDELRDLKRRLDELYKLRAMYKDMLVNRSWNRKKKIRYRS